MVNYLITGTINIKNLNKCRSYIDILYKTVKLANHYEIEPFIIPLDFIAMNY